MTARVLLIVLFLFALLAPTASATEPETTAEAPAEEQALKELVLNDGSTVPYAEAKVRGSLVYLTMASGRMQGFDVADVDLAASGLLPKPEESAETDEKMEAGAAKGLGDLARKGFDAEDTPDEEGAVMVITDADVEHVRPDQPAGAEEEEEGSAALTISDLQQRTGPGGKLVITGTIANSGDKRMSMIQVEATALDDSSSVIANRTVRLARSLDQGEIHDFTVTLEVPASKVTSVNVVAQGQEASAASQGTGPQD